jgi:hypothetical protein
VEAEGVTVVELDVPTEPIDEIATELALEVDHVRVTGCPGCIVVGLAVKDTMEGLVGAGGAGVGAGGSYGGLTMIICEPPSVGPPLLLPPSSTST